MKYLFYFPLIFIACRSLSLSKNSNTITGQFINSTNRITFYGDSSYYFSHIHNKLISKGTYKIVGDTIYFNSTKSANKKIALEKLSSINGGLEFSLNLNFSDWAIATGDPNHQIAGDRFGLYASGDSTNWVFLGSIFNDTLIASSTAVLDPLFVKVEFYTVKCHCSPRVWPDTISLFSNRLDLFENYYAHYSIYFEPDLFFYTPNLKGYLNRTLKNSQGVNQVGSITLYSNDILDGMKLYKDPVYSKSPGQFPAFEMR